ncbi:MAG TPA: hypothetical protein VLA93_21690 [Pyrinomonadaceae bacterium]|nr:hypothetical protein [Pyrinomonadaceae bacterium]
MNTLPMADCRLLIGIINDRELFNPGLALGTHKNKSAIGNRQ